MLDRLQHHAQPLDSYTELRWHANHATRLAMRKGALLQNSQSREGGVSARCYRSGAFGFASRPGDSDAAIVAALAEARATLRFTSSRSAAARRACRRPSRAPAFTITAAAATR